MADEKDKDDAQGRSLPKYRYVEDFEESIDPATGEPYEGIESPTTIETELFGKVEVHRIAKANVVEMVVEQEFPTVGADGSIRIEKKPVLYYDTSMGELGGWVESMANLSQEGDCWVGEKAVVIGEARVVGDAQVKGEAEVGGHAVIRGKAVVDGFAGIGGDALVGGDAKVGGRREELEEDVDEKWKKGMMRKRLAVSENAVVMGTVDGTAKVYGHAKVGGHAKVSGKAKVYGRALVSGEEEYPAKVTDEAEVFGNAKVFGKVAGESRVYGRAVVGKTGKLLKEIILNNGHVDGKMEGYFVADPFALYVGEDSSLKFRERDENVVLTQKAAAWERDKTFNVESGHRASWMIFVGKGCTLEYCSFYGWSVLENTTANRSVVDESILQGCRLDNSSVSRSRLTDCEVSKSILKLTSNLGRAVLDECTTSNIVIPKDASWKGCGGSGVTDVREAKGVVFSGADTSAVGALVGYPYAGKSNYRDNSFNGAVVFEEPYPDEMPETEKAKRMKELQERYKSRQKAMEAVLKPLQERYDEMEKKIIESDEDWNEYYSLMFTVRWIQDWGFHDIYYLDESNWQSVLAAMEKSANVCWETANLYSPAKLWCIIEDNGYPKYVVPQFGKVVKVPAFNRQMVGPYIRTKEFWYHNNATMGGKWSPSWSMNPYPYSAGWLTMEHNYPPSSLSMNQLVAYTEELKESKNGLSVEEDPYKAVNISYADLVEEYRERIKDIEEKYDPLTEENVEDYQKEMKELDEWYDRAYANRMGEEYEESETDEEREARLEREERESKEYWERYEKEQKEREEVLKKEAEEKEKRQTIKEATDAIDYYMVMMRAQDGDDVASLKVLSEYLGELLYGNPSKSSARQMADSAAAIFENYQRKIQKKAGAEGNGG